MTEVRLAVADDIGPLAAMLAHAFAHDPFFSHLAGDAPERNERMRVGWMGLLRHASDGLSTTYTTPDRAGAALWHPPGYGGAGFLGSVRMLPSLVRLAGSYRRLRTISRAVDALDERRREHVPDPHFYLSAVGVDPARQGQGIGSALMRPVLDQADVTGTPAYLETAVARNVLLYERLGFDVVEEMTLPGTDIHGWLMRRPPAQTTGSPATISPDAST
jgi:ribosomal protein S18 acetylase RimI-like enzyme